MDIATMHFWGKTKYWWALIITGILMIPCGLWLWFQPALGYEVFSVVRVAFDSFWNCSAHCIGQC